MRIELLKDAKTLEQLKVLYRKLAFKFHPDRGGNIDLMQKLNNEYDYLSANLSNQFGKFETVAEKEEFKVVIAELMNIFNGLDKFTVELRGTWFWIWGIEKTDKDIKDKIKKLGFFYTYKSKDDILNVWRRKPLEDKQRRTKSMGMDYIDNTFKKTIIKEGNRTYKPQLS